MKPCLFLKIQHGLSHSQAKQAVLKGYVTANGVVVKGLGDCSNALLYNPPTRFEKPTVVQAPVIEPVKAPVKAPVVAKAKTNGKRTKKSRSLR